MRFISLSCHRPNKIVTNCLWFSYLCTFPDLLTRYLALKMTWIHLILILCFPFKLNIYRNMIWMENLRIFVCRWNRKHRKVSAFSSSHWNMSASTLVCRLDTWDYLAFINSGEWKWLLLMFVLLKGIIAVSFHKNICQRQLEHFEHLCPRLVL